MTTPRYDGVSGKDSNEAFSLIDIWSVKYFQINKSTWKLMADYITTGNYPLGGIKVPKIQIYPENSSFKYTLKKREY